ncbi:MAG: translocation/assembly module TamB domain-containing protein [Alistipes sp.]|nr:translocation/assembly module TamB domain-containing protein [Alistipes sp.]
MLLSMPSMQNRAVRWATDFASEKLDAKVSIDHITFGMLNRIKVRGFYVEDLDGDTLLYAGSVMAQIGPLSGITEQFTITSAKAEDVIFNLRETERGPMNVKEITDKLSNPNKKNKKPFKLFIGSTDLERGRFTLTRLAESKGDFGVDYANMQLDSICAHMDNFYVDGAAVGGDVTRIRFTERSGFVLEDMAATYSVDRGVISVSEASLMAEGTQINIPQLTLTGNGWEDYRDFIRRVRLDIDVENSYITSDIVGYFAPTLLRWDTSVSDVTASMHGTVANFNGRIDRLRLEDGGTIRAKATIKGLVDVPRTRFDVQVQNVDVTTAEFVRLLDNIAHLSVPEKITPYIERTDRLNIKGSFVGRLSSFDAAAQVGVGSGGTLSARCTMRPEEDAQIVVADLTAEQLNVSKLLAQKSPISTSFTVKGRAALGENTEADVSGRISSLLFNDYNYSDIAFDGAHNDQMTMLNIASGDSNLQASVRAAMSAMDDGTPVYSAVAQVDRADLAALKINRRDSVSVLSASVSLDAQGATIDQMDGRLDIADAQYEYNDKTLTSDLVELVMESTEDTRQITLSSDFADALFESRCPYKDVVYYVSTLLSRYLPQLYDQSTLDKIERKEEVIKDNVALLSVTAKDIAPLLSCFADGVDVAPNSSVKVYMDPGANKFVMRGKSECIERYPYLVSNVQIDATNSGDSLVLNLGSSELWAGAMRLSDFSLHGGAKDNTLDLYGEFADTLRDVQGQLAAKALISRRNGMRHVRLDVLPSRIGKTDNVWRISSAGIEMDSSRIDVSDLRIYNAKEGQDLVVDGVASRSKTDSLHLYLKNFSLAPFAQFAERIGYRVEGRTNGYVTVRSALKDTRIDANVDLDSIYVNSLAVPDLKLSSRWDFGRSRARLSVETAEDGIEVARGYLFPSQSRYFAQILVEELDVSLLDPLLQGVITDTGGKAKVDLTLTGERRDASLNGEIEVSDMRTTLDYTKCTYTAPKAHITVKDNKFYLRNAPIYDKNNRSGQLSMDLSLDHLSNIEYSVRAQFNDMQVLGTTKRDNDMFYGTIFASGDVLVEGDKAGVKMDITATTGDNSKFFMPLTDKSNISYADFVTFAKPSAVDTTNYLVRKKLMFERRQKQRTASGGGMDINMSLDVRDNAEAQLVIDPTVGDIIKGTGNGLLNLRINPSADIFEMYGLYTIDEGSYLFTLQNIINKKFVIEKGSTIQWTGEPLDALLNIAAVYKIKTSLQPLLEGYMDSTIPTRAVPVNCIINLTDRLTKPTVGFDVQVPSADASMQAVIANVLSTPERRSQQFLYLLLANSFLSENSTEASSFGVSSAAVTGFELLSNQLSNWLSSESFNIVLRYRPKTDQMMSDEVDFGFSQGFMGNRLLVEVEGNYLGDKSQVVNASSSFTGEAYVTWLIDNAGTLRLKGFTHTIDRFDENQGLQETGLGIYFKEDFDNAKDLKNRLTNRFSRRRRKEAQQQAAASLGMSAQDNEAMESMVNGFDAPPQEDNVDNYD